jgi:anti-anti-sigma factor
MVISTRTPEGQPGRCPICGAVLKVEPSDPPGDAPCPCCGHLVWFTVDESADILVIQLTGEFVEPVMLAELVASLDDGTARRIVFDLGRVKYLESAALGVLIDLKKRIRKRGEELTLRGLRPDLLEVFRITRLDHVFRIET